MEVRAKNQKTAELMGDEKGLRRAFGKKIALCIMERISMLQALDNLEQASKIRHFRFHQLSGNRQGQWAIKLDENNRMIIIETSHSTCPPPGTRNLRDIKSVTIIELCIDYH